MTQDSMNTAHITHFSQSSAGTPWPLLAQIPDLSVDDPESLLEEHTAAAEGRLISQSLASKFVLGGGILLVVAAILPFTMAKTTHPKPAESELSRWQSSPAPEADVAPGWSVGGQTAADHSTATGPTGPQRSVVVEAVPTGPGANVKAPAWTDNARGSLAAKSPTPAVGNNPPVPNLPTQMPQTDTAAEFPAGVDRAARAVEMNRPMAIGQGPGSEPRGLAPRLPAPGRGPAEGYRQADTRQTGPVDGRPVYQADERNDRRNTYRGDDRGSQSPGANPLMPDPNREFAPQGPGATQPPPATQAPSTPPSTPVPEQQSPSADTARLDGIIPIPPNQDHP